MQDMQHEHSAISLRTVTYAILFIVLLLGIYFMRNLVYVLLTSIVIASFVDSGVQRRETSDVLQVERVE